VLAQREFKISSFRQNNLARKILLEFEREKKTPFDISQINEELNYEMHLKIKRLRVGLKLPNLTRSCSSFICKTLKQISPPHY
jgi:hypothetical protein